MSSFYNSNNNNGRKVVMGNIMRKNSNELSQFLNQRHNSVDPEVLKSKGNEAYKKGKFEEALALYEKAISLDSNKATYHCNKSAALIGLGRFQEAILECDESIRLDPSYNRAHNRLATIYFRYNHLIMRRFAFSCVQCDFYQGRATSKILMSHPKSRSRFVIFFVCLYPVKDY
jgi:DnaJ family protein C protein 7